MRPLTAFFRTASGVRGEGDQEKGAADLNIPGTFTDARTTPDSGRGHSFAPSGHLSHAGSFPEGDFRNNDLPQVIDIKCEVMVNWLYGQQMENVWCRGNIGEGVILKKSKDLYTTCPKTLMDERQGFYDAVRQLNVRCAMTVNTRVVTLFLQQQELTSIPFAEDLKIQVIPHIGFLPQCRKHQFAAFIQDSGLLVVWDDDPLHILDRARNLEDQLMSMIWKGSSAFEKDDASSRVLVNVAPVGSQDANGETFADESLEKPRKTILIQAFMSPITLTLVIAALGFGFRELAIELKVDKNWLRLAFAAVVPLQMWLALFFMQCLVGSLAQIFGPTNQLASNSKFYSGTAPKRIQSSPLPHVTIQCPVYKEGLYSVINPTVKSIKAAISTYEMQGGSANIFVNDDGMQLLSEKEAQARRDYYEEHNIGWVSRPKHNPKPTDGSAPFVRPGKFKKASNMNYALDVSVRIEDRLASVPTPEVWSQQEENETYTDAFHMVLEEDGGRTWAGGNVRVGDYILLIDSDTRVPSDCLLDAVSEMETSPEVAILQYASGVMNVTDSFFERGITFFTNLVYTMIRYSVANGDVAPFVGHNAILRWSAIQDVAYSTPEGGEKYWSESTVSEDFDMALRVQCAGYLVRLAAYTGSGFKEGVSLTVYDELARWEKYAYGCSELIFHPFKDWIFKGPFTPLFRQFIFSIMPLPSKLTIMAYIGTYYALASAFPLTLANYFIIGWYNGHIDHYYLDSFKLNFSIVIVFTGLGNLALAILRYRIGEKGLFSALVENLKWIPLLTIFLGGVSIHVSQAILSHLFSINMGWGATAKEATETNFFEELPKLFKKFKWTFLLCFSIIAMMIILATGLRGLIPHYWRITFFTPTWPLALTVSAHLMLPTVLNPGLMMFMW